MKTIDVSRASMYTRGSGRNAKTFAQVTFLTGEGSGQRSNTAHPEYRPGSGYIGLNPDQRAVPLNKLYTAEFLAAKADLIGEQMTLSKLEEELLQLETAEPAENMDAAMIAGYKAEIAEAITEAQALVGFAEASVAEAELKLAIVGRELPLEVRFVGADL